jgi:hypothetical protein
MNCWKHHARTVHARVAAAVASGEATVRALPRRLLQVGAGLMDLYLGRLSPESIARESLEWLDALGVAGAPQYRDWLASRGGYAAVDLSDTSRWVVREAPVLDRHVHIHPARYSPHSVRVRANLWKSAIVVLAWASLRSLDPLDVGTVNEARTELLGLSPVKSVREDAGLGELLERFRSTLGPDWQLARPGG